MATGRARDEGTRAGPDSGSAQEDGTRAGAPAGSDAGSAWVDPGSAGSGPRTQQDAPGPVDADPRLAQSEPRLVELIRHEIAAAPAGRITFARFMERALTEPGLGYYATSADRPTRGGDFLTAPELHPFFGRCLGRQLAEAWSLLGEPETFTVREFGAGRGTLDRAVRDGLSADGSGLADALEWVAVDLPDRAAAPAPAPFTGALVANEFLDALPVHRVVQRGETLLERYVSWRDGWFVEEEAELSAPAVAARLEAESIRLADGQVAEVCLAGPEWLAHAAADLAHGLVLLVDYGMEARDLYGPRHMAGTLVTYRGHRVGDDPFSAVGRQDLTAHVDLTALEQAGRDAGLDLLGSISQAEFLAGLGLGELLRDRGRDPATDPEAYLLARASVARLLDPRYLGGFRVALFGRGLPTEPRLRGLSLGHAAKA